MRMTLMMMTAVFESYSISSIIIFLIPDSESEAAFD